MAPLPDRRPKKLSLGPLEQEILQILWDFSCATVKEIHERILTDPDRELAYTSVTTVLNRLEKKGWVKSEKKGRAFYWTPLVSCQEAQVLHSHDRLNNFLAISNPDIVAAFADSLDAGSVEQIEAIASRLRAIRQKREEEK